MDEQVVTRSLNDINVCFSKIILDTNYEIQNQKISWVNYHHGIDKGVAYAAVYQRLVDNKQYSFLLADSSFIQFFFEWNGNNLIKAKLAYYPTPVKISGALEDLLESAEYSGIDLIEELYFGAEIWLERGIDIVNTSYLRLDYDPRATSHSKCHVQIASINELRISSKYILNPFIFFIWIAEHLNLSGFDTILSTQQYSNAVSYHKSRNHDVGEANTNNPFLSNINI